MNNTSAVNVTVPQVGVVEGVSADTIQMAIEASFAQQMRSTIAVHEQALADAESRLDGLQGVQDSLSGLTNSTVDGDGVPVVLVDSAQKDALNAQLAAQGLPALDAEFRPYVVVKQYDRLGNVESTSSKHVAGAQELETLLAGDTVGHTADGGYGHMVMHANGSFTVYEVFEPVVQAVRGSDVAALKSQVGADVKALCDEVHAESQSIKALAGAQIQQMADSAETRRRLRKGKLEHDDKVNEQHKLDNLKAIAKLQLDHTEQLKADRQHEEQMHRTHAAEAHNPNVASRPGRVR
ncbi:MAG TPA: hypothetical protein VHA82_14555 [Ramlibacter sp.]|uniref:hypothetical protein n=1 Tax=Ramlibacter sp. TaxID=1917967 RepID=UPI002BF4E3C2|nr:hypothetical protein [Ramlibacter sp.]HVZ45028.1 hypothetical protein [Ramlibacter sp.]